MASMRIFLFVILLPLRALRKDSYAGLKHTCHYWLFIFSTLSPAFNARCDNSHGQETFVTTWHGELKLSLPNDQLIAELLNSPPLRRLQHINQYGVIQLVDSSGQNDEPFSRYNHSVGVLYLLRKFNAPHTEQVSGLLHDVSHTAFSHISDLLYSDHSGGNPNFHDSLFISFLDKHGLSNILSRYHLLAVDVDPGNPAFTRLERELPDLCADRIDYILQGAGRRCVLSKAERDEILNSLIFDDKSAHWYMNNRQSARLLADASIALNNQIFVTGWGRMLYQWTAKALNTLIALNEVDREDIFYNKTDVQLWNVMLNSKSPKIKALMRQIQSAWYNVSEVPHPDQADEVFKNLRCRIVNPRVITTSGWQRLTSLDNDFRQRFDRESERCRNMYVRITPASHQDDL